MDMDSAERHLMAVFCQAAYYFKGSCDHPDANSRRTLTTKKDRASLIEEYGRAILEKPTQYAKEMICVAPALAALFDGNLAKVAFLENPNAIGYPPPSHGPHLKKNATMRFRDAVKALEDVMEVFGPSYPASHRLEIFADAYLAYRKLSPYI